MKKTFLAVLVTAFLCITVSAFIIDSSGSNAETDGAWTYSVSGEQVTLTAYSGSDVDIQIPTVLGGRTVTHIGNSLFISNTSIRSVVIPQNIISIGTDAFRNSSITSLTIQGNPTVGNYAFRNCQSLNDVDFGNQIQVLGTGMFNSNEAMTVVDLPSSVKTISGSFNYCKNLVDVIIPLGVTTLSGNAFTNTAIDSIVVPHSVTSISSQAFNSCRNLVDVWVHYGLVVPDSTFSGSNSSLIVTEYAVVTLNGQYRYIPIGSSIDNYLTGFDWVYSNGDLWESVLIIEDVTLTSVPIVDLEDPEDLEDPVEPRPVPIYPEGTVVFTSDELFEQIGFVPQFPTYLAIELPDGYSVENLHSSMSYTDPSSISTIWYYSDYGVILAYLYVSEYDSRQYYIFFDLIDENGVSDPRICVIEEIAVQSEYEIIEVMIDSPTVELETHMFYYIEFEGDETLSNWSSGLTFWGSGWVFFHEPGTFTVDATFGGVVTTYTIIVSESVFASRPVLLSVDLINPVDPNDFEDDENFTFVDFLFEFWYLVLILLCIFFYLVLGTKKNKKNKRK